MKSLAKRVLDRLNEADIPNQTKDMRRSPKGGVIAVNGEYYKGGELLPGFYTHHKKGIFKKSKGVPSSAIVGRKRQVKPRNWKVISQELYDYFANQLEEGEYIKDIDGAYESLPYITLDDGSKSQDFDTDKTWRACIWKDKSFVRNIYTDQFLEG